MTAPALESVVCWKWTPTPGYRSEFSAHTVNVLYAMVRRWYPKPVRVICVTDDPQGIDPHVEVIPLWNEFSAVPSPHGKRNPSCYRRLRMFHPEIASVFGRRFVSLDLDCVITGDVSPLWDRSEEFVAWGDTNPQPGSHYNGSMMLLTAGALPHVWERFDPMASPDISYRAGCWGSDQGWISYVLGGGRPKWTKADGVYSFRNDLAANRRRDLPSDARIVLFHGKVDPWSPDTGNYPWVAKHWTQEAACTV